MAAEVSLLRAVGNCPNHVLRSIFPPIVERAYDMRPRPHEYQLHERNYIKSIFPSAQVPTMTLNAYPSIGTIS